MRLMLPHSLRRSRCGYSQPVTLARVIWGLLEVDSSPRREPTLSGVGPVPGDSRPGGRVKKVFTESVGGGVA